MRQDRIVISRRTTPERLAAQLAERGDEPVLVVGMGAHAARLTYWLLQEVSDAIVVPGLNPREHAVLVHPGDGPLLSREPGGPPTLARLDTWRLG